MARHGLGNRAAFSGTTKVVRAKAEVRPARPLALPIRSRPLNSSRPRRLHCSCTCADRDYFIAGHGLFDFSDRGLHGGLLHVAGGYTLIEQLSPRPSACPPPAHRRSPFGRVEFLTLSSDAGPDRDGHGDGTCRTRALVKSEKFQMNHECAIAGSGFSAPTTGFSARYFDLR
jgi:hypothetical protein